MQLIVVAAFADYAVGDHITDTVAVEQYLHSPHVVRIADLDATPEQTVEQER